MKTSSLLLFITLLTMPAMAQTPATQNPPAEKAPEKAKDINLNEVIITKKKPLIVQEIDKTVVNVESMISAAASNTLEVLEKTPGISINSNGEISLNGRSGVLVLIDGKNTYLSGQDLAAYLKSLPGGNLDKIELIDNPSAKYDASGNAIINIRLKKNRIGGLTGSVSLGASLGRYARNNDAVNLNYNHKKLNLFANLGYNEEKNYREDHFDRRFFSEGGALISTVDLQNNLVYKDRGFNANIGMDYAATAKTVYGFIFNVNKGRRNGVFNYESNDFDAKNRLERTGEGDTRAKDTRTNLGFNFNLQHKFDSKGKELSADINYLNYNSNGNQALQNFTYAPEGALIGQETFRYVIPAGIDIYTAKADYVHPLKNKARIEAGFKSSIVDNDNLNKFYNVRGAEETIDNRQSNHFKYHENINAVYLNSQKSWKRLGVQIGLRAENTLVRGNQLGNDEVRGSSFTKNYTGLFPSAYISYKLDTLGKNTLGLMAVRRITRPNYQLLNPFVFYRDQYSYTSGNPMLNPQYQSRIELKFQHKQFLNMGLSYNTFSDLIFQTTEAVNDIFTTRPKNIAGGFMLLLNTTVSTSPTKWWYLNYTARLSKIGMNGRVYTENLHFDVNILRLEINNYFTISPSWNAELGGYYASRDMNGQTLTKGMYRVNGAVQKKIWKGKGSLRVAFDDIFHSWIYNNRSLSLKQSEYFQTSESDTQRISFAMTYRFGKETFARKRRHNNNASDEEKGRIE
ncbi:outer membrane beta-barrel protein [Dyadobacter fanqingshengii]|uniref:Outer membrane beta-barrel protein n=1 Tax=Dyadobacter fanqingshengii TaxID=2906443 RepID=A0A9X1PCY6_9BACT|nr:outer membrane beta-barrel protein [Dyadobacter fanqingshengii]MCF0042242.1 outer membrane beta-barrel protein [Dyadobacter fanqingshengii]USJ35229.1 outer membrane beta-barrel protein [Dyadobacter fanqingshengii]